MIIGLVHYPITTAPVSGSVTVTTQCANNAHRKSSSLNVTCTSSGNWSGITTECECDTGYRAVTGSGRLICKVCKDYSSHISIVFISVLPACKARVIGLVHYPATTAPASGSVTVNTQCADNAHRTSSNLNVSCTSSGNWSGTTPHCQCDTGYCAVTVSRRQIFQGW